MTPDECITEAQKIMKAGAGPFTRKMIATVLEEKHNLSHQEAMLYAGQARLVGVGITELFNIFDIHVVFLCEDCFYTTPGWSQLGIFI